MTDAELEALIDRAAKRGADEALKRIGLHDEHAGDDVREVRGLLEAWRTARAVARHAMVDVAKRVLSLIFFAFLIIFLGQHIPPHLNPFEGGP